MHYEVEMARAVERSAASRRSMMVRHQCAKVASYVQTLASVVEYNDAVWGIRRGSKPQNDVALVAAPVEPLDNMLPVDLAGAVLVALGNEPAAALAEWEREERMELAAKTLGLDPYEAANVLDPVPIDEGIAPWGRMDFDTPCQPADHIMPCDYASALLRLAAGEVAWRAWM